MAQLAKEAPKTFWGKVKHTAVGAAPKALVTSAAIGAGYAAKKLHDIYEKRESKKDLERNFDYVMQNVPELAANPNVRSYFDTIANFSPSLAKDPNTLTTLLNQFDTFDGVDLNTVKIMRDIEKAKDVSQVKDLVTTVKGVVSV